MSLASRSGVVVVSKRAREMRRRGTPEALAAAHARVHELREHPELLRLPEEWAFARRSGLYVVLSATLLLHLALSSHMPESYRVLAASVAVKVLFFRNRGPRTPQGTRREACLGWAAACIVGVVGLLIARGDRASNVFGTVLVFGGATFALGCAIAADMRKFRVGGIRWLLAVVLVLMLLSLHAELVRSAPSGHG